ncbi:MAG: alkaline phosphatase family protein [Euryarchaeota archaeon]|nr:alkaline phosphatase family protein [Euryarchaeota archaeon]
MGERKTYIINIDGMRADYFNAIGHQGSLTPTLDFLADNGILFTNCKSTMPANTGTNHTSILTSTHAGIHGILGIGGYYQGLDFNHFRFSRKYGMAKANIYTHQHLQVPTIFNIIKTQSPYLTTSFITGKPWLGQIIPDENCDITIYPENTSESHGMHNPNPGYVTPSEGYVLGGLAHPEDNSLFPRMYIPAKNESTPRAPPGTINLSPVHFDADKLPSDQWVVDQAIHCIDHDNPDFLYMVMMNMDLAGHSYGSCITEENPLETDVINLSTLRNPNATRDQLFITDQKVKRFIDHLKTKHMFDDARIIITADHGMSTMKALYTQETKQQMLDWILEKLHLINDTAYTPFTPLKFSEQLVVDVRQILEDHDIHMRASPDKFLQRYNPHGGYDWCISEGPNGYIYNASAERQSEIKDILLNYSIIENETTVHPVWNVLTADEQESAINDYDGKPFHIGKGNFLDVIWPSIMIFCRPHYMIPMYHDQLMSALMPLMIKMKLPGFVDIRTAMGAHGTYLEQDVPLIMVSRNEPMVPVGVANGDQVSVLDILPTIHTLNGWSIPSSYEGESLLP